MKITPFVKALLAKLPKMELCTVYLLDGRMVISEYQARVLTSFRSVDPARITKKEFCIDPSKAIAAQDLE